MVKIKAKELIKQVLNILFILFLIYLIFELMRKILGGSLGFEGLATALLVANLGYSFYLQRSFSDMQGKIGTVDSKLSEHIGWHKGRNHE